MAESEKHPSLLHMALITTVIFLMILAPGANPIKRFEGYN
jgi:hypothetical protein